MSHRPNRRREFEVQKPTRWCIKVQNGFKITEIILYIHDCCISTPTWKESMLLCNRQFLHTTNITVLGMLHNIASPWYQTQLHITKYNNVCIADKTVGWTTMKSSLELHTKFSCQQLPMHYYKQCPVPV